MPGMREIRRLSAVCERKPEAREMLDRVPPTSGGQWCMTKFSCIASICSRVRTALVSSKPVENTVALSNATATSRVRASTAFSGTTVPASLSGGPSPGRLGQRFLGLRQARGAQRISPGHARWCPGMRNWRRGLPVIADVLSRVTGRLVLGVERAALRPRRAALCVPHPLLAAAIQQECFRRLPSAATAPASALGRRRS